MDQAEKGNSRTVSGIESCPATVRGDRQACYTFVLPSCRFVGIAPAIQRSSVVMHSAEGQRKCAIVIGGSIGGLFAGLFLRKVGWDVSIHERAGEELGSRGAGIATHDELHEALALATEQDGEVGVAVEGRIVLACNGDVVCEVARPQVLASWDRIWHRLRLRADDVYHHGSALASVEQDEQRVVARFDDGGEVAADLLVAADGIQSTVRRQLLPAAEPRYAGYVAWRGLAGMGELSGKSHDLLRNRFAFCLPDREQVLGYPVDGDPGSGGRYNCVWYRPADPAKDLPRLLTGTDGRQYSIAVPPDRLHPDVLARMRADATSLLAPPFAEVMTKARQPLLQAIVDLETPAMIVGRVALLGDAAFVARPHVGMGTTKAAGDARALADHLARHDDIDAALAAYGAERLAYGQRVVRRGRHLGAYMQAQIASEEEQRQAQHFRKPEVVMTETASMLGLENW
jgi:2-polyprenyl-6-methoxyphenol hydroxylase-like FAD-dependent oxidoreductase